jgi:hypothetical protein
MAAVLAVVVAGLHIRRATAMMVARVARQIMWAETVQVTLGLAVVAVAAGVRLVDLGFSPALLAVKQLPLAVLQ